MKSVVLGLRGDTTHFLKEFFERSSIFVSDCFANTRVMAEIGSESTRSRRSSGMFSTCLGGHITIFLFDPNHIDNREPIFYQPLRPLQNRI
jgi:hypothetical protein